MPSRAAKRSRLRQEKEPVETVVQSEINGDKYFAKLPLEMIGEILSYTSTPDILAVARSCKLFHRILVLNPNAQFIWKSSRQRFGNKNFFDVNYKGIPDPPKIFTEASYAAFLFDQAPCEVCNANTNAFPFSFLLRARLCNNDSCPRSWKARLCHVKHNLSLLPAIERAHAAAVITWLPRLEDEQSPHYSYRCNDWNSAIAQHKVATTDAGLYVTLLREYAEKSVRWIDTLNESKVMFSWLQRARAWQKHLHDANLVLLKTKALGETWEEQDFIKTKIYKNLLVSKQALFETITPEDFSCLKEEFRRQVAAIRQKRIQRAIDKIGQANRDALHRYWNRLNTVQRDPFPSYGEFRSLQVSKVLLKKSADEVNALKPKQDETLWEELTHNSTTQSHVTTQIRAWLQEKRLKFSKKLGYPEPELDIAAGLIPPAERITAWFNCTNCSREKDKHKPMGFRDVCKHHCFTSSAAHRMRAAWNADWFMPDTQAIAVMKKLVQLLKRDERVITMGDLENIDSAIFCKSCTPYITLPISCLMRHSHRHDDMEIEILSIPEAMTSEISHSPVKEGLVSYLLRDSAVIKSQRDKRIFQCRHCHEVSTKTFDGLRSHVIAKHKISLIGDEDIQTLAEIDITHKKAKKQTGGAGNT